MCGLIQSTLVSVPEIWIFLFMSNTALVEWCAHNDPAAINTNATAQIRYLKAALLRSSLLLLQSGVKALNL